MLLTYFLGVRILAILGEVVKEKPKMYLLKCFIYNVINP